MTQTQTKTPAAAAATPEQPPAQLPATQNKGGAVARIAPARLPYHPAIENTFGVDRSQWRALTDSIFPLAKTTEAVILALSYCKARHLDVMKKPVHIVPMWNGELGREVETVWPAITEHRITAHRTGVYAGSDRTVFGPTITEKFQATVKKGKQAGKKLEATVTFPEFAEITVYRIVQGERVAFPGPRIYYREFFGMTMGEPVPNARWARSASQMLEKCAEAAALRKAFTEEIGGEPIAEEMEGRIIEQVLSAINKDRPQAPIRTGDHVVPDNEIIDESEGPVAVAPAAAEGEEGADEGDAPIEHDEGQEEQRQDPPKPDRGAEWLSDRIAELPAIKDQAGLTQKDKAVRAMLAKEKRDDLIPGWEKALKAAADALPAEEGKKTEPAKDLTQAEQEYLDFKNDALARVKKASMTRTVDDIQDEVLKDLHEEDKQPFIDACNARAKELLADKKK